MDIDNSLLDRLVALYIIYKEFREQIHSLPVSLERLEINTELDRMELNARMRERTDYQLKKSIFLARYNHIF